MDVAEYLSPVSPTFCKKSSLNKKVFKLKGIKCISGNHRLDKIVQPSKLKNIIL